MLFFYGLMAVYWLRRWSSYRCCLLDAMCDTCLSIQGVLNSRPHSYFSYHCHRNVNRLRYCSRHWNQLGDIFTLQLPVSRVLVQVTVLKFRYRLLFVGGGWGFLENKVWGLNKNNCSLCRVQIEIEGCFWRMWRIFWPKLCTFVGLWSFHRQQVPPKRS